MDRNVLALMCYLVNVTLKSFGFGKESNMCGNKAALIAAASAHARYSKSGIEYKSDPPFFLIKLLQHPPAWTMFL